MTTTALRESSFRIARRLVVLAGSMLVATLLVGATRSTGRPSELIAFTRADGVYVMNSDGSGVRAVRRGIAVDTMHWSPNGRKLAFTEYARGLWTMKADGSELMRLVASGGTAALTRLLDPTWTPDGGRIAFTAARVGERDRDIWIVDADGRHLRRLARTPQVWEFHVDWSPAGNRIAFTDTTGYVFRLYVMNADGASRRVVNPNWRTLQALAPEWSPDGRRLAFTGFRQRQSPTGDTLPSVSDIEIWVANASGSLRVRLTRNAITDSDPVWSPDGRKIAFVRGAREPLLLLPPATRSPAEIYVMNADGTGVTRLTDNDLGEGKPAWQPPAAGDRAQTERPAGQTLPLTHGWQSP